jgi:hypothetical protein
MTSTTPPGAVRPAVLAAAATPDAAIRDKVGVLIFH